MKTIESITKALAAELKGWEYAESKYDTPELCAVNGATIRLGTVRYRLTEEVTGENRLELTVGWPEAVISWPDGAEGKHFYPHGETFKITVSAGRTIASIARDVERRLLPKYLPRYDDMLERKREYVKRRRRTERNANSIATALGVDHAEGAHTIHVTGDAWGKFEVDGDGVRIVLNNVDIDLALIIAVAVRRGS